MFQVIFCDNCDTHDACYYSGAQCLRKSRFKVKGEFIYNQYFEQINHEKPILMQHCHECTRKPVCSFNNTCSRAHNKFNFGQRQALIFEPIQYFVKKRKPLIDIILDFIFRRE